MRKTLAFILAAAMILAVACVAAFAADDDLVPAGYAPDAEAKPITSETDFLAMESGNKYYLANDITINTQYNTALDYETKPFAGTIDGCGKTITTTVPLFFNMAGTVKNLILKGSVTLTDDTAPNAALVQKPNNTLTITNCVSYVDLAGGDASGAFVGYGATGCYLTVDKCVNNGSVSGDNQVGGLLGYVQGITADITDCVNNGEVASTANYSGGIVGRFGKDAAGIDYVCRITGCVNNGPVTAPKAQCAGILGYHVGMIYITACINYGKITNDTVHAGGITGAGSGKETNMILIDGCFNYGEITGAQYVGGIAGKTPTAAAAGGYNYVIQNCGNFGKIVSISDLPEPTDGSTNAVTNGAGGIAGYFYGGSTDNGIYNCFNMGEIYVKNTKPADKMLSSAGKEIFSYACGLIGYLNSSIFHVENCYNTGKITGEFEAGYVCEFFFDVSEGGAMFALNDWCYMSVEPDHVYAVNGSIGFEPNFFTDTDLETGKLCYEINKGAGNFVFFEKLGTDKFPTPVKKDDGYVGLLGTSYVNIEKPAETTTAEVTTPEETEEETNPPRTKAPDTTPATPDSKPADTTAKPADTTAKPEEKKGCGGFTAAAGIVVVFVAALGTALVVKKH